MEPFIGQILMFGGNFAPRGWALCDGQLLEISQYTALFSLLGTTYGGDGRTTFALPDFRGRAPIHAGTGPGLTTRKLGERSGEENVILNALEIPSHTHPATFAATPSSIAISASSSQGTESAPGSNGATTLAATTSDGRSPGQALYNNEQPNVNLNTGLQTGITGTVTVGNAGGNQSHDNMQPYLTVNYIIALTGMYPPRS